MKAILLMDAAPVPQVITGATMAAPAFFVGIIILIGVIIGKISKRDKGRSENDE